MKNKFILIIFLINIGMSQSTYSMNSVNHPNDKVEKTFFLYSNKSSALYKPNQSNKQNQLTNKSTSQAFSILPSNKPNHLVAKTSSDSSLNTSYQLKTNNETLLIQIICKKNFSAENTQHIQSIQKILNDKKTNINYQNKWGNTALHYTSILYLPKIAIMLLVDPRTNTTIKNNNGFRAHDYIHEEYFTKTQKLQETETITIEDLKKMFFARFTLDFIVEEESFAVLVTERITREKLNDLAKKVDLLDSILKTIKGRIEKDNQNQEQYQEIPEQCRLPHYATDEFIKNMIFNLLYDKSL